MLMKKILYSILLFAGVSGILSACNGDYTASPSSAANGLVNPLDPLTISQFTWGGTSPLSCTVNGVSFVADSTLTNWSLDSGFNVISGFKDSLTGMVLYLDNVYGNNLYSMNYNNYLRYAVWIDSNGVSDSYYVSALGNSGGIYITENDSAYIKGLFYFEGVSTNGRVVAINNGYMNIKKP
jgi:hypothetical protein